MFRKRTREILRQGLKSLDELDTTKEVERLIIKNSSLSKDVLILLDSELGSYRVLNIDVVTTLSSNFNPLDPF